MPDPNPRDKNLKRLKKLEAENKMLRAKLLAAHNTIAKQQRDHATLLGAKTRYIHYRGD